MEGARRATGIPALEAVDTYTESDLIDAARAQRNSVVEPAQRSPSAQAKAHLKRTKEGWPVHSFQTLLKDLATICRNRIQPRVPGAPTFDKITIPTAVQQRALQLLRLRL